MTGVTTETTHSKHAAGKAMTLDELRALVAELDELGAAGDTPVEARGGWSGSRTLTAKVTSRGGPRPGARPFGDLDGEGHLAGGYDDHELWLVSAWLPRGRGGEFAAFLAANGVEAYRMHQARDEAERQPRDQAR